MVNISSYSHEHCDADVRNLRIHSAIISVRLGCGGLVKTRRVALPDVVGSAYHTHRKVETVTPSSRISCWYSPRAFFFNFSSIHEPTQNLVTCGCRSVDALATAQKLFADLRELHPFATPTSKRRCRNSVDKFYDCLSSFRLDKIYGISRG